MNGNKLYRVTNKIYEIRKRRIQRGDMGAKTPPPIPDSEATVWNLLCVSSKFNVFIYLNFLLSLPNNYSKTTKYHI